jgi:kinesin family protein 2/24
MQVSCLNPRVVVHAPKLRVDGITKYLENTAFEFDHAFDDDSTTEELYKYSVMPLVAFAFKTRGRGTVIAYGQTGSGKTFTMSAVQQIVARDIFRALRTEEFRDRGLCVHVSFLEIYGARCCDLLHGRNPVVIREDGKQRVQAAGLQSVECTSADELLRCIVKGGEERTTHSTEMNQQSSRSHAICEITIRDSTRGDRVHGSISLVDLAGSERAADSRNHDRQRRVESAEINKSLLALKECIRALAQKADTPEDMHVHVPFRASKLTLMLRDSFVSENARVVMIAAVSPAASCADHTQNTLRYADRVKEKSASGLAALAGRAAAANGHNAPDEQLAFIMEDEELEDFDEDEEDDEAPSRGGRLPPVPASAAPSAAKGGRVPLSQPRGSLPGNARMAGASSSVPASAAKARVAAPAAPAAPAGSRRVSGGSAARRGASDMDIDSDGGSGVTPVSSLDGDIDMAAGDAPYGHGAASSSVSSSGARVQPRRSVTGAAAAGPARSSVGAAPVSAAARAAPPRQSGASAVARPGAGRSSAGPEVLAAPRVSPLTVLPEPDIADDFAEESVPQPPAAGIAMRGAAGPSAKARPGASVQSTPDRVATDARARPSSAANGMLSPEAHAHRASAAPADRAGFVSRIPAPSAAAAAASAPSEDVSASAGLRRMVRGGAAVASSSIAEAPAASRPMNLKDKLREKGRIAASGIKPRGSAFAAVEPQRMEYDEEEFEEADEAENVGRSAVTSSPKHKELEMLHATLRRDGASEAAAPGRASGGKAGRASASSHSDFKETSLLDYHLVESDLIEEEENLLNAHMTAIQEGAELLTEEGQLLAKVQGRGVVDYDIDEYANRLHELLARKLDTTKRLLHRLNKFRQQLVLEEQVSQRLDDNGLDLA